MLSVCNSEAEKKAAHLCNEKFCIQGRLPYCINLNFEQYAVTHLPLQFLGYSTSMYGDGQRATKATAFCSLPVNY
jgi:hypothetical protein